MDWLQLAFAIGFAAFGALCLFAVLLGLPGTWILLAAAAAIELFDGFVVRGADPVSFGWTRIGVGIGLATVGEILEAGAGVAGTRFGGGSRRGMVGAFVGGILGAILLTPLIPVPILGTLLGALIGTFVGAWIGEATAEQASGHAVTFRAALGAAAGKLAGTFGKAALGVVVWVVLVRGALI